MQNERESRTEPVVGPVVFLPQKKREAGDKTMFIVRVMDFPNCTVKGAVRLDEEGNYNIYLNAKHSFETLERTKKHEYNHIVKEHFSEEIPVALAEAEADGEVE